METLYSLRRQVLAQIDELGDAATGTTTVNVNHFLNQAHQLRLSRQPWGFMLWDTPETFSTTAATQTYPLHQEFNRPLYFYNRTTKRYLVETPMRNLGPSGARWNDDQGGDRFALWGRSPVQTQPSSASAITIVSSSGSDTGSGKAITVRGVTANGVTTESITPTGLTPAAGATSFTKILQVTKAGAWVGTMTMTSNAGAVTNLKLFPTEFGRSYQQLYLLSTPAANDVIEYRFYRNPSPLDNDYDVPDIPPPFQQVLVWDALLLIAAYDDQISPSRLAVWQKKQQEFDIAMAQTLDEGQSLHAEPSYIRFDADDAGY